MDYGNCFQNLLAMHLPKHLRKKAWTGLLLFTLLVGCDQNQIEINNNTMEPIQEAITGNESIGNKETPYEALVEFYKAFNQRDIGLMENNWANSEEIAMDNPLGGIMRGWSNISQVYKRIFEGQAKVYVEYYDYTIHENETSDMFYAVGRERGYFATGDRSIDLEIRTSRIFKKIEGRWRQVHHHGSIEDPELLTRYQSLVRK
jgi:ketosteroid isomerase-like protein